jgi:methionyl-tRNA synthetase
MEPSAGGSAAAPADPSSERFCVTTAINYANGLPHMGHAYEAVSADAIARYHRAYGRQVRQPPAGAACTQAGWERLRS